MRIPYAPSTPGPDATQEEKDIYARIAERRKPRPLIPLDLALLHAPPVANGWNGFLGAIRSKTGLSPAAEMELAICRVAVLNRAAFEWDAHAKLAVKGDDALSREALGTVLGAEEFTGKDVLAKLGERRKEPTGGLTARQWAVLAYTDQMTRNVQVEQGVFDVVREEFGERQTVELTATIAAYNCVSRFLAALDVGERNGGEMVIPEDAK